MDGGQVIAGRYRLVDRLGGGGMGVVWQAHDERLRRTVAVKEVRLPPGLDESRLEEIRRRTMREGRIAAKLHHPQAIAVYDVIEDDHRPFIIMEYLPSNSLSRVLDERGALPPAEVARIGAQAAAALASAHAAGVVHRDIKPANILVGDDGTVKITDFGVSRVVEDVTGTSTGTFLGTPAYLAPEVAQGRDVTFASDAFSLGATLYTAVEGAPPAGRSENTMLLLHRIASGEIVPPKQAGPLTGILTRLLSADPEQRPAMAEAAQRLAEVADGRVSTPAAIPAPVPAGDAAPTVVLTESVPPATALPTAVPPASPAPQANPGPAQDPARKRRRALVGLAALFIAVAVITTLVALNANDGSPDENAAPPPAGESSTPAGTSSEQTTTTSTEDDSTAEQPPATEESPTPSLPPQNPPPDDAGPGNPVTAVTGYYALMPGNLEQAWTRLTPRFQESPAGGWGGYTSYWNDIDSVRASDASGGGSSVEVTVEYAFKDGRQIRERHRYRLVNENGRWLMDSVAVLSSTTLS